MGYAESEVPVGFSNKHILDELGDVAFFKEVQFHKQSLMQTEWRAFGPLVTRDSPAHKVSKVLLKYRRLSWYYVQNIVLAMLFISSLALISFVMGVTDLGSRVSTCLTVVLTVVAFKFIVTSSLPKVPYNTCIDYYINAASMVLIVITYFSVVPSLFLGDDEGVSLNRNLGVFSAALVLSSFFFWLLYSIWVASRWRLTSAVEIKKDKNWYAFWFSTPDFLDKEKIAATWIDAEPDNSCFVPVGIC